MLPTLVLVLVSYHLIGRSIERWAGHQIANTLENSALILRDAKELAHNLELHETDLLTHTAEILAVDFDLVAGLDSLNLENVGIRSAELADDNAEYLIAVYDRLGNRIFTSVSSDLPPLNLAEFLNPLDELPDAPTVSEELENQGYLICGMPIFSEDGVLRLGAIVVGKSMPLTPAQTRSQMVSIKNSLGSIKSQLGTLESNMDAGGTVNRRTEKRTTSIALVITAVLVIALSFWVSRSLARGINTPIQSLVAGTKQIADGNLDYKVEVLTDDEFADLARAFNRMGNDLKKRTEELRRAEQIAAWQDVAQKLAHEIKNPLTPIQLSAQRLQRRYQNGGEDFGELLDRCTQTIITEVEGLRHLLDEFSLLARMPSPQIASVNLRETIDETLELFDNVPSNIVCQIDASPDLPLVTADAEYLKRAFFNLIKNALEAMSETNEPSLTIRAFTSADASKVCVQFSDTGPGIPAEMRPKLFMPHVSTKKEGMGLGLAIVKKILTDLGGDIRVEESKFDSAGATFTLWLKAVEAET
ncbi:MAG: ATP-binding protein [Candidatus Poribacteria bacterium]|nr:ATP-binding protein [Candidatus Poribacteria bacterium]